MTTKKKGQWPPNNPPAGRPQAKKPQEVQVDDVELPPANNEGERVTAGFVGTCEDCGMMFMPGVELVRIVDDHGYEYFIHDNKQCNPI